ncbi:MAG TPA: hypothetical protein VI248_07200, partial [Kineosporiaceae bacterium]
VTRANNRRLTDTRHTSWVRNGDAWRVVHRRADGALTVEHLTTSARLVLPPGYVAADVELLYATTAHRVQGATVDTAHALVTADAATTACSPGPGTPHRPRHNWPRSSPAPPTSCD